MTLESIGFWYPWVKSCQIYCSKERTAPYCTHFLNHDAYTLCNTMASKHRPVTKSQPHRQKPRPWSTMLRLPPLKPGSLVFLHCCFSRKWCCKNQKLQWTSSISTEILVETPHVRIIRFRDCQSLVVKVWAVASIATAPFRKWAGSWTCAL